MELSDEAINIISCACYPAHMQAAEDFIAKLEADRDEYRNLYHMGEAKITSREAIIEQLSESELAKDVTRLEAKLERLDVEMLTTDDEGNPVGCGMDLLDWQAHLQTELGVERLHTRELEAENEKVISYSNELEKRIGEHIKKIDRGNEAIAELKAELAKWTDGRKLVKYVEGLEAESEALREWLMDDFTRSYMENDMTQEEAEHQAKLAIDALLTGENDENTG